jgi:hypothetical protein
MSPPVQLRPTLSSPLLNPLHPPPPVATDRCNAKLGGRRGLVRVSTVAARGKFTYLGLGFTGTFGAFFYFISIVAHISGFPVDLESDAMDYYPDTPDDPMFYGLAVGCPEVCTTHGHEPLKCVAFQGWNIGRHFYMCSVPNVSKYCQFLYLLLSDLVDVRLFQCVKFA